MIVNDRVPEYLSLAVMIKEVLQLGPWLFQPCHAALLTQRSIYFSTTLAPVGVLQILHKE